MQEARSSGGGQRRARVAHVASPRHTDTAPATPFGMSRIESTRSAPNAGWTRLRETMPAMSGQSWRSSPPARPHRVLRPKSNGLSFRLAPSWQPAADTRRDWKEEKGNMHSTIGLRMIVLALVLAVGPLAAITPSYAQTQGQERREDRRDDRQDARDTRQTGRQGARDAKAECKKGDEKTRAECRQDKRDTKQDTRESARDAKKD